jgi:predicted dehydrogenase
LLSASIITGHGLGMKEGYQNSWRSDKQRHRGGVFETVSIHFLDFFIYLYGPPVQFSAYCNHFAPRGNSIDNCLFSCQFENAITLTIYSSYTSPFVSCLLFLYENGVVSYNEDKLICYPRETFDEKGLFSQPPVQFRKKVNRKAIAQNSLIESLKYFFKHIDKNQDFNLKDFHTALESNKIILQTISQG